MTLEARDLTFHYHPKGPAIIEHLDLVLQSEERLGLTGPSGRGKTTLCRLLAGYDRPDAGEVLLDGKPLSTYRGYCPVQMVWQHPELVVDPLRTLGTTLSEGWAVEERVLTGLHIEPGWLTRYPSELSGGELQRFCVARALGPATRFLLCDELSAMLDLITQAQIWSFLLEEAERRDLGLLIVSHSSPLLERLCTRTQTL
ncbi:ABC transporter ATP-binding protein [Intestinimonas timonensis]|uniref:ABC transporter ATP-binding protein n=1 Tax=Intestinimonas timonensis TaxID=1689270 RepID=UPI001031F74C|nr:ATP-binding cassette domain-containing protein [Intestinimonas timonensis]